MLTVVLTVLFAGLLMAALVGTSVDDFSENLPSYQARLQGQTKNAIVWLAGVGVDVPEQFLREYFDPGKAMKLAAKVLTGFTGALTNTFLILLTVIFILLEASSFPGKLRSVLDDPDTSLKGFETFTENVKRYVAIKTSVSVLTGATIAIWLWAL